MLEATQLSAHPERPTAALAAPGALAGVLERAGLRVIDHGEVACPFVFPSAEISWRANASAGVNQLAIAQSGEAAVRTALAEADRGHRRPDGSIRYENVFLWVAGKRPEWRSPATTPRSAGAAKVAEDVITRSARAGKGQEQ